MSRTKVSVVIPVYNNTDAAVHAIFSVLRQTSPVHEIIIVDDASDIKVLNANERPLRGCGSTIPIRLIRLNENVGPGGARHAGANAATGTHVAFLDADDFWHHRKIEKIQETITGYGAELIGHNRPWALRIFRRDLTDLAATTRVRKLRRVEFLARNPIPTSSIVAKASIAREMFRFGGRKSEDYMALMIASGITNRIFYIDENLCWAPKPPFGVSGEGANQMKIYRMSIANTMTLYKERLISAWELVIFFIFLCLRVPVGLLRLRRYRKLYGSQGVEKA